MSQHSKKSNHNFTSFHCVCLFVSFLHKSNMYFLHGKQSSNRAFNNNGINHPFKNPHSSLIHPSTHHPLHVSMHTWHTGSPREKNSATGSAAFTDTAPMWSIISSLASIEFLPLLISHDVLWSFHVIQRD